MMEAETNRRSTSGRSALVLGAVALVALGGWRLTAELQPKVGSWVRVERDDLVIGVELEGELEAVESVTLGPPQIRRTWEFKISMLAPEGTEATAGQTVVSFDTTQLQQRLRDKLAERDASEKELEKKATDLEAERRQSELTLAEARAGLRRADLKLRAPEEAIQKVEIEKARIDQDLAKLEIEAGEKRLEYLGHRGIAELAWLREKRDLAAARVVELEDQIERMAVKAPRSGTIIHLADRQGDKVKVGDSVWRGRTFLEIPDLGHMRGDGIVEEADAGYLAAGQPVTLRLDAYPDRLYRGRVESIRRAVQRKSRGNPQKVVKVEIGIDKTDRERMRPGMRFRGEIEVQRVERTLLLPLEAVRLGADGPRVTVRGFWGTREVKPSFGARNAHFFEILSGLEEGDRVLQHGVTLGEDS